VCSLRSVFPIFSLRSVSPYLREVERVGLVGRRNCDAKRKSRVQNGVGE